MATARFIDHYREGDNYVIHMAIDGDGSLLTQGDSSVEYRVEIPFDTMQALTPTQRRALIASKIRQQRRELKGIRDETQLPTPDATITVPDN